MKKSAALTCDFLVIGSGLAGLMTALKLAPKGKVILVTKGTIEDGATETPQKMAEDLYERAFIRGPVHTM